MTAPDLRPVQSRESGSLRARGPFRTRGRVEYSAAELAAMQRLGAELRRRRDGAGLTLAVLEPIAGSRRSLEDVEAGRVRTRASRLRPWLAALGTDPQEIAELLERHALAIAPAYGASMWTPITRGPVRVAPPRLEPAPAAPADPAPGARLGAHLWRARVAARLRRSEIARRIGCATFTVWRVEHGRRRPSGDLVEAWIEACGAERREPISVLGLLYRYPGSISYRPGSFARRPRINSTTHQRATAPREGP